MKVLRIYKIQYITVLQILFSLVYASSVKAQDLDFKGQISSWGTGIRLKSDWNGNFGLRYIPQFNISYPVNETDILNAEIMFNTYYGTDFHSKDYAFKFYRTILRYTTSQTETQLGLQKINFGPAQLLRPLMWFDRVDPRDPLKLTDGVWGLRYKYSFMDNSLLWLWGLYGNKDTKGYEIFPTANETPEFGGRFQMPIPLGEIAATFHTRKARITNDVIAGMINSAGTFDYRENRYALDGRWDIGIGLWFESVWQQNNFDMQNILGQQNSSERVTDPEQPNVPVIPIYKWNRMTTIGGDYTIPAGNGIYVLAEHMFSAASNTFWNADNSSSISALMLTYPLGVLDNLALQEYYNWQDKNIYQYFQWQRTYDNFIINASLFHYPESGSGVLFSQNKSAPVAGYGVQLMLIYNY